jgi:sulfatase maturation enzyme AslB (radical SAM superfamily)
MKYAKIPMPTFIAFEPINLCNAKCFCCPYTTLSEDKSYHGKRMTREQLKTLLDDYGSLIKKYGMKDYACGINPWRYSDPLVQPDLEYILQLCDQHKIHVGITTNGVSFTKKQCEILNRYEHVLGPIHMSVIGHTAEELWDFMKVKKQKTLDGLHFVKANYPALSRRIRIGVKHKDQSKNAPNSVMEEYSSATLGRVKSKTNWVENRIGDGDGNWTKPYDATIDENFYMQGCAMGGGRILRQMEILVNGQVVLCCDDADGKTNYGNVFESGIEAVWKNLQKEHDIIYSTDYIEGKKNLICNTCSRGKFVGNWTKPMQDKLHKRQNSVVNKIRNI